MIGSLSKYSPVKNPGIAANYYQNKLMFDTLFNWGDNLLE